MSIEIVARDAWCDTPRTAEPPAIRLPAPRVWLHHGASGSSSADTARSYARFHIRDRGYFDIGYSFLIAGGRVLEGRGAGRAGAHTRGDNAASHGICVVGDYRSRVPSGGDLDALIWLLRHGAEQGWWPTPALTGGHRDAPGASTLCPGDGLYRLIPDINRRALGTPKPEPEPSPLEAVMSAGEKQLQALADQTGRLADAKRAEAQTRVAQAVAKIRSHYGREADPHSDAIHAVRVVNGSQTLEDVAERLRVSS